MNSNEILSGHSFLPHKNPKKLIFMLHGYGDSAQNFINIAPSIDNINIKANYFALDGPSIIPNYSQGREWFDLYPNGTYIADANSEDLKIVDLEILKANQRLENTINKTIDNYKLSYKDCLLLGFSQGGMMTFEFGNYFKHILGGLAILSGRIMREDLITNQSLLRTPIFISHGTNDNVLSIKFYEQACKFFDKHSLLYESYKIENDTHMISLNAIIFLQKFIKKNL